MAGDTTRRLYRTKHQQQRHRWHAKSEPAVSTALGGEPIHPLAGCWCNSSGPSPGATAAGETPAQWVLAPAGMPLKAGEGVMGLAGAEVRVDPLAEWKQIYRELWRIEGAISTMLTCMASTPSRWRKNTSHTWKPCPRATT